MNEYKCISNIMFYFILKMKLNSTNIRFIDLFCAVYVLFCMFRLKEVTIQGAGGMVITQKTYTEQADTSATLQ
jgi:hypothetical protein